MATIIIGYTTGSNITGKYNNEKMQLIEEDPLADSTDTVYGDMLFCDIPSLADGTSKFDLHYTSRLSYVL